MTPNERNLLKSSTWRARKKAEGLCSYCGQRPVDGNISKSRCAPCVEKRRARAVERRQERRATGLCPYCRAPRQDNRKVTCGECAIARRNVTKTALDKKRFLEMYGGKCACCAEANPMFLTADHINRDGALERRQPGRKRGYAHYIRELRSDIQILCFNCNCGREINKGICPHKSILQL